MNNPKEMNTQMLITDSTSFSFGTQVIKEEKGFSIFDPVDYEEIKRAPKTDKKKELNVNTLTLWWGK